MDGRKFAHSFHRRLEFRVYTPVPDGFTDGYIWHLDMNILSIPVRVVLFVSLPNVLTI